MKSRLFSFNLALRATISIMPSYASTGAITTHPAIEDTPAYTSALQANGCCVECAMRPISSFRSAYHCDAVDPFSCICDNKTLSVQLKSDISSDCYNHCGISSIPFGTSILIGYCSVNGTLDVSGTVDVSGTESLATPTGAPSSGSRSVVPTPTSSSEIVEGGEGLKLADKIGIAIGVLAVVIAALGIGIQLWRRRAAALDEDTEMKIARPTAGDST